MTSAVILYGSRARGDHRPNSDIDLILSEKRGGPSAPKTLNGASVHFYPQNWLRARAKSGDLFVAHVALEGQGICDPDNFLSQLRKELKLKPSYANEKAVAAAAVALLTRKDWEFVSEVKRRYFWALRTIGATISAEKGRPVFASGAVEEVLQISGLEKHISNREEATFSECRHFADKILESHRFLDVLGSLEIDYLTDFLMTSNIGRSTVALFETHEMQEFAASALYS